MRFSPLSGTGEEGDLCVVDELRTTFHTESGSVTAVDGVSVSIRAGRTLGIVGESGSGKSVLSRSIMGLLPRKNVERSGSIEYQGRDISHWERDRLRDLWGTEMAMVLQDPMTSLTPVVRVGRQITESIRHHLGHSKSEAKAQAISLLHEVGIPEPELRFSSYPHQLSGGMRQRATIAMALACDPKLLFADEPTTALDVTVQAQILDLLDRERSERGMAIVLVTHDLGVVASHADDVVVMYAGQIVEQAPVAQLFAAVRMPYTEALLASIPRLENEPHTRLRAISGRPPDLLATPEGCRFAPRCPYAQPKCLREAPPLRGSTEQHRWRCWFPVGSPENREALATNVDAGVTAAGMPLAPERREVA